MTDPVDFADCIHEPQSRAPNFKNQVNVTIEPRSVLDLILKECV